MLNLVLNNCDTQKPHLLPLCNLTPISREPIHSFSSCNERMIGLRVEMKLGADGQPDRAIPKKP